CILLSRDQTRVEHDSRCKPTTGTRDQLQADSKQCTVSPPRRLLAKPRPGMTNEGVGSTQLSSFINPEVRQQSSSLALLGPPPPEFHPE
ncbi:unnamed protein product, partial [Ectocarpus sp. 12 AP-2014]